MSGVLEMPCVFRLFMNSTDVPVGVGFNFSGVQIGTDLT